MSARSALDALAEALVTEGVAPTVALGFARKEGSLWRTYTGGDRARIFDLASLTKPMTAVALQRTGLRAEPLGELLEEARGTKIERAPLELALAHRIGLDAHVPLFLRDLLEPRAALEIVARSTRAGCDGVLPNGGHPPLYSDLGYILAGVALARHAGVVDAGAAIDRLVVAPLSLEEELGTAREFTAKIGAAFHERVVPTETVAWRGGTVRGVVHDENAWVLTKDGGSGHAGMFGTIEGVLRFATHVLDERERYAWLIERRPGGTLRAGFDGKSAEGSSAGSLLSNDAFGHLGFTGTSFWIDPDAEIVVSLLTNRVHPRRDNARIKEARPRTHDALFALAREKGASEPTF